MPATRKNKKTLVVGSHPRPEPESEPETVTEPESGMSTQQANSMKDCELERHDCGMCGKKLDGHNIGCDKCQAWVHAIVMCSGLPQDVIRVLLEYDGGGIEYICTNCRAPKVSNPENGRTAAPHQASKEQVPTELITQLFHSVKGMCVTISELSARLDSALGQLHRPGPQSTPPRQMPPMPDPDLGDSRNLIREEVREIQEQAKRRQSVIIRGLQASSPNEVSTKFGSLSETVFGSKVELSTVTPIQGHVDLYRAKILNEDHRKLVLENSRKLKSSQDYSHVFIRRDLTFKQREELKRRRAAAGLQQPNNPGSPSSVQTVAGNSTIGHSNSTPPAGPRDQSEN